MFTESEEKVVARRSARKFAQDALCALLTLVLVFGCFPIIQSDAASVDMIKETSSEEVSGPVEIDSIKVTFDANADGMPFTVKGKMGDFAIADDGKERVLPEAGFTVSDPSYELAGWSTTEDGEDRDDDPATKDEDESMKAVSIGLEQAFTGYSFTAAEKDGDSGDAALTPAGSNGKVLDISDYARDGEVVLYAQWNAPADDAGNDDGEEPASGGEEPEHADDVAVTDEAAAASSWPDGGNEESSGSNSSEGPSSGSISPDEEAGSASEGGDLSLPDGSDSPLLDDGALSSTTKAFLASPKPKRAAYAPMAASENGTRITNATVKWLSASTGADEPANRERLVLAPEDDTMPDHQFQLDFELSGKTSYDPGSIEIAFPRYIWKDRQGYDILPLVASGLSVPSENASGTELVDFVFKFVGDDVVITNNRRLPANTSVMIQGHWEGWDTRVHAIADGTVSSPFSATVSVVTPEGEELSASTNEIDAQLSSYLAIEQLYKTANRTRTLYNVYTTQPSEISERLVPQGASGEDYVYVRWYVAVSMLGNQPAKMTLTDQADENFGGLVLGVQVGSAGYPSSDGKSVTFDIFDTYSTSVHSCYIWTAYPRSNLGEDGRTYEFANTVTATATGWDGAADERTATASARFKEPQSWSASVTWLDSDDARGYRPASVTAYVYRMSTENDTAWSMWRSFELSDANGWSASWRDEGATEYVYRVLMFDNVLIFNTRTGMYEFRGIVPPSEMSLAVKTPRNLTATGTDDDTGELYGYRFMSSVTNSAAHHVTVTNRLYTKLPQTHKIQKIWANDGELTGERDDEMTLWVSKDLKWYVPTYLAEDVRASNTYVNAFGELEQGRWLSVDVDAAGDWTGYFTDDDPYPHAYAAHEYEDVYDYTLRPYKDWTVTTVDADGAKSTYGYQYLETRSHSALADDPNGAVDAYYITNTLDITYEYAPIRPWHPGEAETLLSKKAANYTSARTYPVMQESYATDVVNGLADGDVLPEFAVDGRSFHETLTMDGSTVADRYKRDVTLSVEDDSVSLGGEALSAGDYRFSYVKWAKAGPVMTAQRERESVYEDYGYGTFDSGGDYSAVVECFEFGEWTAYARVSRSGGELSVTALRGALYEDEILSLPASVQPFRARVRATSSSAAALKVSYSVGVELLASPTVESIVDDALEAGDYVSLPLVNSVTLHVLDADGGESTLKSLRNEDTSPKTASETAYVHARNQRIASALDKKFKITYNDRVLQQITVHADLALTQQSNIMLAKQWADALEAGTIPISDGGTWFELIPKGMLVDMSSIQVGPGDVVEDAWVVENFRDTGQSLLCVKVSFGPHQSFQYSMSASQVPSCIWDSQEARAAWPESGYRTTQTLSFDCLYPWLYVKKYGMDGIRNVCAFESGDATVGNVPGFKGEPDDPSAGNHILTEELLGSQYMDIMKDLDPARDDPAFVYGGTIMENMHVDFRAMSGITKQVATLGESLWWGSGRDLQPDYEPSVTVGEDGVYMYKLTARAASETWLKDLFIVDALENYQLDPDVNSSEYANEQSNGWVSGDGSVKTWRGRLLSLDLTELVEIGIDPVVYWTDEPGVDVSGLYSVDGSGNRVFDSAAVTEMWHRGIPTLEQGAAATAIAIDCRAVNGNADDKHTDLSGNFMLNSEDSISVIAYMRAPTSALGYYADSDGDGVDDGLDPSKNAHAYNEVYMGGTRFDGISGTMSYSNEQPVYSNNAYTKVGIESNVLYVKKTWDDDDDNDRIRPSSVHVTLTANGESTQHEAILDESNGWTAAFEHLPSVDECNQHITYSVEEDPVPGYALSSISRQDNVITLTNRHVPETVELPVSKAWAGDMDAETGEVSQYRPSYVTVELYKDGTKTNQAVTLSAANGWRSSFQELRKYDGGRLIEYDVGERDVAGGRYKATYAELDDGTISITNTLHPYGDLRVEKYVTGATEASGSPAFTFTFEFSDEDGFPVSEPYGYTTSDGRSGQLLSGNTIALEGGQYVVIEEIPHGISYKVTEEQLPGYALESGDGSGTIKANADNTVSFVNRYSAKGSVQIVADKELSGALMKRGQFRFELLDEDGEVIRTASDKVDPAATDYRDGTDERGVEASYGTATFGTLEYGQHDSGNLFRYTVRELDRGADGYSYDPETYSVTVLPRDNGDGTMSISVSYADGNGRTVSRPAFENAYEADGSFELKAYKAMKGRALAGDDFEYDLFSVDADGTLSPLSSTTNDVNGEIAWPAISCDESDIGKILLFAAKERAGGDPDVVYDDQYQGYKVEVVDNGNGSLSFNQTTWSTSFEDGRLTFDAQQGDESTFTNTLVPGSLSIQKQISGGDEDAVFTFHVDMYNEDFDGSEQWQYDKFPVGVHPGDPAPQSSGPGRLVDDLIWGLVRALVPEKAYADDDIVPWTNRTNTITSITNSVKWKIDSAGVLHVEPISGDVGTLVIRRNSENPWNDYRSQITAVAAPENGTIDLRALPMSGSDNSSGGLFMDCINLADVSGLSRWTTSGSTNLSRLFSGCTSLRDVSALASWDTSNVVYMREMFKACTSLEKIGFSDWNVSNVTTMDSMFSGCTGLTDVSGMTTWVRAGTASATIADFFYGCSSVESVDLSSWGASFKLNGESNFKAFSGCTSLKYLDLSGPSITMNSNTNLFRLLLECSSLEYLDLSGWTMDIPNWSQRIMMGDCTSLKTFRMTSGGRILTTGSYPINGRVVDYDLPDHEASDGYKGTWTRLEDSAEVTTAELNAFFMHSNTSPEYGTYVWTVEDPYTISFNSNGGAGEMPSRMCRPGYDEQLLPCKFDSDYPFVGWSLTRDNQQLAYPDQGTVPAGTYSAGDEIELFAIWDIPNEYTLLFDAGDGAGLMGSETSQGGEDYQIPASRFYWYDHVQTGWLDSMGRTWDLEDTIGAWTYGGGAVVTLTAIWQADAHVRTGNGFDITLKPGERAVFPDIPAGTAFTVYEEPLPGWSLSSSNGTTGSIDAGAESAATFLNSYDPRSTSVSITGRKTVDGGPDGVAGYTFDLYESGSSEPISTATTTASGSIVFSPLPYSLAGVHGYEIRERAGDSATIEYDSHVEQVTVTVTENDDGDLCADVSYDADGAVFDNVSKPGSITVRKLTDRKSSAEFAMRLSIPGLTAAQMSALSFSGPDGPYSLDEDGTVEFSLSGGEQLSVSNVPAHSRYSVSELGVLAGDGYDAMPSHGWSQTSSSGTSGEVAPAETSTASFSNTYSASGTASITAYKHLSGGPLPSGKFTFSLRDEDGHEVSTASNSLPVPDGAHEGDGAVTFAELSFDSPGSYQYTVMELGGTRDDVSYSDEVLSATVTMTDDGDGNLVPSVTWASGADTITNTVKTASLMLRKDISGATSVSEGQEFEFSVTLSDDGAPIASSGPYPVSILSDDEPYGALAEGYTPSSAMSLPDTGWDSIEFDANGGRFSVGGGDYAYNVIVVGTVAATPEEGAYLVPLPPSSGTAFAGWYTSASCKDGDEFDWASYAASGTAGEERVFTVYAKWADARIPTVIQASTDASGRLGITLSGGQLATVSGLPFGASYSVSEENPPGWSMFSSMGSSGTLGNTAARASLSNSYHASGQATISASKQLDGGDLENAQFSFELRDEYGTLLQAAGNDASGNITFDPISYTEADAQQTHLYYIYEVAGDIPGMVYDERIHEVAVTVTDNGDGTLSTSVLYDDEVDPSVFVNDYQVGKLVVTKAVAGESPDPTTEFSFKVTLTPPNGTPEEHEFTLADGESREFAKLLPGTSYTVEEDVWQDGWYKVSEGSLDGTISSHQTSSKTVTNAYLGYVSLEGQKTWESDTALTRPLSITVNLMDGDDVVATTTTSAAEGWAYHFDGLPELRSDAETRIEYSVSEERVDGYEASYDGLDITNELVSVPLALPASGGFLGGIVALLGLGLVVAGRRLSRDDGGDGATGSRSSEPSPCPPIKRRRFRYMCGIRKAIIPAAGAMLVCALAMLACLSMPSPAHAATVTAGEVGDEAYFACKLLDGHVTDDGKLEDAAFAPSAPEKLWQAAGYGGNSSPAALVSAIAADEEDEAGKASLPIAAAANDHGQLSKLSGGVPADLDEGYYVVFGGISAVPSLVAVPASGALSFTPKGISPEFEKTVLGPDGQYGPYSYATVGKPVKFRLELRLPSSFEYYRQYPLDVTDELGDSFDVREGAVTSIEVGPSTAGSKPASPLLSVMTLPQLLSGTFSTELPDGSYDISYGDHLMGASIEDAKAIVPDPAGKSIFVYYDAYLSDAFTTGAAAPNVTRAKMSYPTDAAGTDMSGETGWSSTRTYTFALEVSKKAAGTGEPLAGAAFSLRDGDGTYLADGPSWGVADARSLFVTGDDGKLLVRGLGPDSYTLSEEEAPDGYELVPDSAVDIAAEGDVDLKLSASASEPLSLDQVDSAIGLVAVSLEDPEAGDVPPVSWGPHPASTSSFPKLGDVAPWAVPAAVALGGALAFLFLKSRKKRKESDEGGSP